MGDTASAETVVKMAVKNTHATVRKQNKPARNRRPVFKAWTVSKLLEAYEDPRAILLSIASTDTAALAKEMNASLADALAERRLAAQCVLPYVAQKLPVQVDMNHSHRAIHLNLLSPAEFAEVEALANTADTPDSDGFSMQLIAASPVQETTEQANQTPEPQQPGTAEGVGRGGDMPVSLAVPADVSREAAPTPGERVDPRVEWLPPLSEWWRKIDGVSARTTKLPDTPAADDRDRWQRDGNASWAPGKPK